jgi:hypothetical protein
MSMTDKSLRVNLHHVVEDDLRCLEKLRSAQVEGHQCRQRPKVRRFEAAIQMAGLHIHGVTTIGTTKAEAATRAALRRICSAESECAISTLSRRSTLVCIFFVV